ncbi:MAG TPA: NDP-sugar synthase [Actinomycetota bacterium]|nr:NDP-sugar synthase [Actinomycetota bacterium]
MNAIVLVGGFGTRMRPLTETVKKELLPLVDRPILGHTLDRLVAHGVHHVVMSSPYLEEAFHPFIQARRDEPTITWVTEERPLGTGGAIVHALDAIGDQPFFALNGDILTDLDLTAMMRAHRDGAAAVTIALHHVPDARAFGLVERAADGRVTAFLEKPEETVPGDVNAGTYIVEPEVLRRWTADREISIEREIFPAVIGAGSVVVGFSAEAYWLDLGTPEKYLQAHADVLDGKVRGLRYPNPWIAPDASVDVAARVGARVAVGPEARIGPDAVVEESVLLAGADVGAEAHIERTIVGPGAHVGRGASIRDGVLGAGSRVPDRLELIGTKVGVDAVASPA